MQQWRLYLLVVIDVSSGEHQSSGPIRPTLSCLYSGRYETYETDISTARSHDADTADDAQILFLFRSTPDCWSAAEQTLDPTPVSVPGDRWALSVGHEGIEWE